MDCAGTKTNGRGGFTRAHRIERASDETKAMAGRMTIGGRARHYLIQVLCLFTRAPRLRLTDEARSELLLKISQITDFQPAATLLWTATSESRKTRGEPQWHLAFYNIATRPYGRVRKIQGIPFVFVQVTAYERLDGATVDFRDGRLVVLEKH